MAAAGAVSLDAEFRTAFGSIVDLQVAVGRLDTERAAALADVNTLTVTVAERDARIVTLEARVAELEALVTPPPPARTAPLLIGATVDARAGESISAATATFEQQLGAPLNIVRRFFKSLPATFNTGTILADATAGRSVWLSVKTDANADQLAAAWRTLPRRDGVIYLVTVHHEPDNDIKQGQLDHTPAWFAGRLAANGAAVDQVRSEGRLDIVKSLVVTGWLEYDNAAEDSTPWFPADPAGWVCGFDPYDISGRFTLAELAAKVSASWRRHGGRMWAITEAGSKRTGSDLAKSITDAIAFCDADPDCVAWCYYHGSQGENGPWWLDDPAGRKALGDALRANAARWAGYPLMRGT